MTDIELVLAFIIFMISVILGLWRRALGTTIIAVFVVLLTPLILWQAGAIGLELTLLMLVFGIFSLIIMIIEVRRA